MSTQDLIAELRGFAEGSNSARATLMRDAADALEWHMTQEAGLRDDIASLEAEKREITDAMVEAAVEAASGLWFSWSGATAKETMRAALEAAEAAR